MSGSAAARNGGGRCGYDSWVFSMERELQRWRNGTTTHRTSGPAAATIHRVPPSMRDDLGSVEPAVVSIGPYHHGEARLLPMEQHKWRSLDAVLELNRNRALQDYLLEMTDLEARARSCYSEDVAGMGSQEFTAMLLLDGCFLAEAFLGAQAASGRPRWFTPGVARDFLLLENQIPFFVVQKIAELAYSSGANAVEPSSLPKRVAETLRDLLGLHANMPMESASLQTHHHLLHLLHSLFFRPVLESEPPEAVRSKKILDGDSRFNAPRMMLGLLPSASELQDAGVKLKKREHRGLLDATFTDSTMQVPFLRFDHFTAPLLKNLVAWESSHGAVGGTCGQQVTAYVLFMDRLVRTAGDVGVLAEKGIVENRLNSDGVVVCLFDRLAAGIPVDLDGGCYLKPMLQRLRRYQRSNLHKWKAWIKREFSGKEEFYLGLLLSY